MAAKTAAITALGRFGPIAIAAALVAAPVGGRAGGALVPLLAKPARPDGLGALMKGFSPLRLAAGWLLGSLPLVVFLATGSWQIMAAAAATSLLGALLGGVWMARLYSSRVGGFTGDALGAAVEIGELACLLGFLGLHRLFA
jgi:adenosylcobinamide-GDP ribazoletransferase